MARDCAAPRHDGEPVEASPHAWLCDECRSRLRRDLKRLPFLDTELEQHVMAVRHGNGRGHHGDGLPYNDAVSECRSQIRHDLSWWTRTIAEDRNCELPVLTTASMAGFILAAKWVVYRGFAGELADVTAANAGRAMALLDPWITRRFDIPGTDGRCLTCDYGRLQVTVYASDGDKRRSFVACSHCDHSWLTEQWTRLGEQIIARRAAA